MPPSPALHSQRHHTTTTDHQLILPVINMFSVILHSFYSNLSKFKANRLKPPVQYALHFFMANFKLQLQLEIAHKPVGKMRIFKCKLLRKGAKLSLIHSFTHSVIRSIRWISINSQLNKANRQEHRQAEYNSFVLPHLQVTDDNQIVQVAP